jgi:hypothetical protein
MVKQKAAFPLVQTPGYNFNPGVSERTYIAIHVMQSLLTMGLYEQSDIPKIAYRMADEMINYNAK